MFVRCTLFWILVVLSAAVPALGNEVPRNCPLVFNDQSTGGMIVMSQVEREAVVASLKRAQELGRDGELRLLTINEALLELSDTNEERREDDAKGAAVSGGLTAAELTDRINARVNSYGPAWREGPLSLEKFHVDQANNLPVIDASALSEPLEHFADLAEQGYRPRNWDPVLFVFGGGHLTLPHFRSAVAIVDPRSFDNESVPLVNRALCSGVRISETAILTAAHCVCTLGLDNPQNTDESTTNGHARKVRFGSVAAMGFENFKGEADVLPGKTRCFGGTGPTSCQSNFCERWDRRGFPEALNGTDIAIIFVDPGQMAAVPESWRRMATIAGNPFAQLRLSDSTERAFLVASGYDREPAAGTNATVEHGLGIRGCGQMIPGRRCGLGLTPSCMFSREFRLTGDPQVNSQTQACPGDSGGPVYLMDTIAGEKRFYLAGIVSRGLSRPGRPLWEQCGGPGIYSAIGEQTVLKWIQNVLRAADEPEARVRR